MPVAARSGTDLGAKMSSSSGVGYKKQILEMIAGLDGDMESWFTETSRVRRWISDAETISFPAFHAGIGRKRKPLNCNSCRSATPFTKNLDPLVRSISASLGRPKHLDTPLRRIARSER